ncbi:MULTISPECIES: Uma2 family endonuclease [Streptomyces]|uniref:Uma2 family endonuclease n=1 Tax=Streptomyces mirabilis TaxID=68239 RepID=A0ABU3UNB7_9ACTN|nr:MULTISPECIES: Uma2 family endonuclease [Streptomyces]MCX4611277.1 Uma2 family endonuclease [Streptomyces mirabilis]MDU8995019.1 Uma2 family endonuclease [Streptomyces mirabilis]NMI60476.1 Uma2 family endonuclease [Streptomyces sp. RLA2-12]QDN59637.1 Uma2 family endonuclease [Streptomyces sp. S1D4-20]QDN69714.1 Uma2 family endonuclease [Streptomyces sp. S1D4-14]
MAVLQHKLTLGEAADLLSRALPGHRVEILQGRLTATPPPDGSHAQSLSWLVVAFDGAGARKAGLRYVQGIGLWLPALPDDYAIPDFSVVDEDFRDALVQKNCYAPNVFRLVMEVTSSNWSDDLGPKVESYAEAGIPVYIVVDRKHDEVLLYQDPVDGKYDAPQRFKRGQSVPVPDSVGVSLDLAVDTLLDGD